MVDNVRELAQVHALGGLGRQYGLVFTTWDEDIAPAMRADPVEVGALTEKQALELLGLWCDRRASRLPAAARQVCAQVQNLALGVVTAGAMVARGHSLTDVPALLEQGADRVRGDLDPEYPYRGLPAAIEAALTTLPEEDQDRYARLAVFAGRGPFPRAAAERLWGPELSPAQVADLLADLVNRALLTPAGPDRYTAHDPHYDVMFSRLGGEDGTDLAAAHAHLIERYRRPGTWAHAAADPYLGPRLIGHLSAAGYAEELRTVLADVAWIRARLAHGGLSGLLADYDYADDALGLQIARALRMSADAVTADPELVAVQLAARLLSHPDPEVAEWARALDRPDRRLWPAGPYPALTPATEPLVETQFGYDNEMFKVAISADGSTAISGDVAGSIRVWDLTGDGEPRVLTGHTAQVAAVAISADGTIAAGGDIEGSVRVWDLATAECIASWIGDHPIKGCTVISGELPRIGVGQNRGAPYLLELRRTA